MALDGRDLLQNAIGAFSGVIFIFLLRQDPLWIDPTNGLIIGVIWLTLIYSPFTPQSKEAKFHFAASIIISIAITTYLSIAFGLVTFKELLGFQFFGSLPFLTALIGVPVAVLFDKKNINNPMLRYFFRKK